MIIQLNSGTPKVVSTAVQSVLADRIALADAGLTSSHSATITEMPLETVSNGEAITSGIFTPAATIAPALTCSVESGPISTSASIHITGPIVAVNRPLPALSEADTASVIGMNFVTYAESQINSKDLTVVAENVDLWPRENIHSEVYMWKDIDIPLVYGQTEYDKEEIKVHNQVIEDCKWYAEYINFVAPR